MAVLSLAVMLVSASPAAAGPGMATGWGYNFYGELGNGTKATSVVAPVPVCEGGASSCTATERRLKEVAALAAGTGFGLALLQDGEATTWGSNGYGELGIGTTAESSLVPVPVCELGASSCTATEHHLKEVAAVASGGDKSLALLKDGEVVAWGYNGYGQLGDGTDTGPECSVSEPCSRVPVPVCEEGASSCTATEHRLKEVVAVAGGSQHSLALLKNGEVVAWGLNLYGQLGNGTTTNHSDVPVPVCEPGASSCAATEHRLKEVVAIAAGGSFSLALLKDGEVVAWGFNSSGQLGDGTRAGPELCNGGPETCSRVPVPVCEEGASSCTATEHRLKEVAAVAGGGGGFALARRQDGEVVAWGDNSEGQLGDVKTRAEQEFSDVPVPICEEGARSCTATEHRLKEVAAVAGGEFHGLAVRKDGGVVAWGRNFNGELGDGTKCEGLECSRVPMPVCEEGAGSCTATEHRLKDIEAVAAGGSFSLAIAASPVEKLEYNNWVLSGSLTPAKLGEPITLPTGSTYNASGERNIETGSGSLTGSLLVPPFTEILTPLGLFPNFYGMTVTQVGPINGSITKSEAVPGDVTLTLPLKLRIGFTTVRTFSNMNVPIDCATSEPVSLNLVENLTPEELRAKGWHFTGTTSLPSINCFGNFFSAYFAAELTRSLSGPENPYSISIAP